MRHFTVLIVALVAGVCVAADQTTQSTAPRSPAAVTALKKYERVSQQAEQAYRRAMLEAKRELVEELQAAKTTAMRNGSLDEAVRIDALIKQTLQDEQVVSGAAKQFTIDAAKDWQETVPVEAGQTVTIRAAGKWSIGIDGRGTRHWCGPDGEPDGKGRTGYLEMCIGDGPVIAVHSSATVRAEQAGMIRLRQKDTGGRVDNLGSSVVSISVR